MNMIGLMLMIVNGTNLRGMNLNDIMIGQRQSGVIVVVIEVDGMEIDRINFYMKCVL